MNANVYNVILPDYLANSSSLPDDDESISHNVWGYYYGFSYQVYHPLALTFCFTGLVTNIINMAVFSHPEMRNSTNYLLTAVALADILICLQRSCRSIAYFVNPTVNDYVYVMTIMYSCFMYVVEYTAILMSEWFSVTLAIWRFIAVTWPLKAKTLCSTKRAKIATISVAICSVVTPLPCFLLVSTKWAVFQGLPIYLLTPKTINGVQFGIEHDSFMVVLCLTVTLPIVILLIITIGLIRNTIKARKRRRALTGIQLLDDEANRSRITLMLIVILGTFTLTNIPSTVLTVAYLIPNYPIKFSITFYNNFFQSVLIMGNSANFIIYLCMSSKYRLTFRTFLAKIRLDRRKRCLSRETTSTIVPDYI